MWRARRGRAGLCGLEWPSRRGGGAALADALGLDEGHDHVLVDRAARDGDGDARAVLDPQRGHVLALDAVLGSDAAVRAVLGLAIGRRGGGDVEQDSGLGSGL